MIEDTPKRLEPPAVKPRKNSRPVFFWLVGFALIFILLISLAFNLILFLGASMGGATSLSKKSRGVDEFPTFVEKWSYGKGDVKVARIPIKGVIARISGDGFFAPKYDKVEAILNQIKFARQDKEVKALLVEVDSPGGAITPSDEIYEALKKFKADDPERKILVFTKDLAASGGYYVAMAADRIMAEPTAIIGSIGVIMQSYNWHGLTEKHGISDVTIKSGDNKDLLNPFRAVSTNQIKLLQGMVDDMYERFLGIVVEGRGMDEDKARALADGRVFSAEAAKEEGLIDELGYWDDAVSSVSDLLGESSVKIVRYGREASFLDLFGELKMPEQVQTLLENTGPRMMYMWRP